MKGQVFQGSAISFLHDIFSKIKERGDARSIKGYQHQGEAKKKKGSRHPWEDWDQNALVFFSASLGKMDPQGGEVPFSRIKKEGREDLVRRCSFEFAGLIGMTMVITKAFLLGAFNGRGGRGSQRRKTWGKNGFHKDVTKIQEKLETAIGFRRGLSRRCGRGLRRHEWALGNVNGECGGKGRRLYHYLL